MAETIEVSDGTNISVIEVVSTNVSIEVSSSDDSITIYSGEQGPAGPSGADGATGAQGPSGVIGVTSPITNSGSSTSATIGINQSLLTISPSQVTGTAVVTSDARLSDTRTPTDGSVTTAKIANNAVTVAKTAAPSEGVSAGVGAVYFVSNTTGSITKSGAASPYTYTWVITHGIGRFPLVCQIFNTTGQAIATGSFGVKPGKLVTASQIARVASSNTVTVSATSHGLSIGDKISVTGLPSANSNANGIFTIDSAGFTTNSFTYITTGGTTAFTISTAFQVYGKLDTISTVQYLSTATAVPADNTVKAVLIG